MTIPGAMEEPWEPIAIGAAMAGATWLAASGTSCGTSCGTSRTGRGCMAEVQKGDISWAKADPSVEGVEGVEGVEAIQCYNVHTYCLSIVGVLFLWTVHSCLAVFCAPFCWDPPDDSRCILIPACEVCVLSLDCGSGRAWRHGSTKGSFQVCSPTNWEQHEHLRCCVKTSEIQDNHRISWIIYIVDIYWGITWHNLATL
jgi:hypothetical protein